MPEAKNGDTVRVHYTGKLDDGTVFDSSKQREEPLEFTLGEMQVIPGFENAVVGMNVGDAKDINIPSADAYGPHSPEMVQELPRNEFPPDLEISLGQTLQLRQGDGKEFLVLVTGLTDDTVTLDANHPLAGKDLNFEIELVEIV